MLEDTNLSIKGRLYRKVTIICTMLLAFLFFNYTIAQEVPNSIFLGGLEVEIEYSAKIQIELAMTKLQTDWSTSTFKDKASLYIPLISDIFSEEGIPNFLVSVAIQKNNLNNTLSNTEKVGLWELNQDFAEEWILVSNEQIDERLNIYKATEAVAKLLKRNNLYFKNWFFSLWSLESGFDYVKEQSKIYALKEINNNQKIVLNESSPSFFLEFIACRIMYESLLQQELNTNDRLLIYQKGANKKFSQIAKEFNVDEKHIKEHNPWLKSNKIPSDKIHSVLIPLSSFDIHWQEYPNQNKPSVIEPQTQLVKKIQPNDLNPPIPVETLVHPPSPDIHHKPDVDYFHDIVILDPSPSNDLEIEDVSNNSVSIISDIEIQENKEEDIDEITLHIVVSGQTLFSIAHLYQISLSNLRKWNGLGNKDDIFPGNKLIVSPINKPANIIEHIVQEGETLYQIAELYNIRIEEIQKWNNKGISYDIDAGEVLIIIPNSKIYLAPIQKTFPEKHKQETPLFKD